ncbi:MAG: hypothetical protein LUD14_09520 [Clostridiales bacterium]|nr:hypothetical protein [Clostridiales bacterium]
MNNSGLMIAKGKGMINYFYENSRDKNGNVRPDIIYLQKKSSAIISQWIRIIVFYMDKDVPDSQRVSELIDDYLPSNFFDEFDRYYKEKKSVEFVAKKFSRMVDKLENLEIEYEFDIFEKFLINKLVAFLNAYFLQLQPEKRLIYFDNQAHHIHDITVDLLKTYGYKDEDDAINVATKACRFEHLAFSNRSDDNYFEEKALTFFSNNFCEGLRKCTSQGELVGIYYDDVCNIFTDIDLKIPLELVGTKEASILRNQIFRDNNRKYR